MTKDELKGLLDGRTNDEFVDREILSRRPWIFGSDEEYTAWCAAVSGALEIQGQYIRIVGSAATGYSLSPLKAGRPFRRLDEGRASDIDVAFMNDELFEDAWNTIVAFDRQRRLGWMSTDERTKTRVDIYWGVVAHKNLPINTDPARRILTAVSVATRMPPIRGHIVRCRVYRREEDLRAYHVVSLRQLRAELEV
jgi:hypothetical protein